MAEANLLTQFSNDLADVHERVTPSLVQIRRGGRGIGAGSIWTSDGLLLTNAHVVDARGRVAADLSVRLSDGRDLPAEVVAVDPHDDLAALRVAGESFQPIELGDSAALHAGQVVLAFGFPYGVTGGATVGAVIGESDLPQSGRRGRRWLAASLHLRPGHSGGPMVDAEGRLVGINTMMNGPDVGVAVPVNAAREFLLRVQAGSRIGPITTTGDRVVQV